MFAARNMLFARPTPASGAVFDASAYGTLLAWLESDKITSLSNNDPLEQWDDFHTTENHAAQVIVGQQPKYVTELLNGLPAVNFGSDTDRFLEFGTVMTTVRTIVTVERWESTAGSYRVHMGWVNPNGSADGSYYEMHGAGAELFSSSYASSYVLSDTGFVNGVEVSQAAMLKDTFWNVRIIRTTNNITLNSLANDRRFGGRSFIGDRAVVLLYSDRLSDGACADITAALNAKYAVYGGAPVLGWEAIVPISSVGDSIVSTEGTLIEAVSLGDFTDRTVNGVLFDAQLTRDDLSYGYGDTPVYRDGVIGSDFENMMDCFAHNSYGPTVTLTGLTSGKTYMVQVFVSDDRFSEVSDRTQTFQIGSFTSSAEKMGDSYSRKCYFTAAGTTQVMTLAGVNASAAALNAFQVRQID